MNDGKRDQAGVTADVSADVIQAALESVESGSAKPARSPDAPDAVGTIELDLPEPAPDSELPPSNAAHDKAIQELQAQLDLSVERARETLDRLKDTHERYLRAAADLENYKKRALREKEEAERYGVQRLLKDLLPVVDNLERALSHAEASNPLTDGIQATRRIFEDTLGRYGVKGFSAVGQAFDPNRHEAMQQIETSDSPPGMVVSEMVRGYTLHDRLIRPALVAVSAAPSVVAPVPAAVEASPAAPVATEVPPAQPEGGKVS